MKAYQLGPDDDDEDSHCRGPSAEDDDGPEKDQEIDPPSGPGPEDDDNDEAK